jgi:hypothetical protein
MSEVVINPTLDVGYDQLQAVSCGREVFRVNPARRIERNGVDITDDDHALAECLVEFLQVAHGVTVSRTR